MRHVIMHHAPPKPHLECCFFYKYRGFIYSDCSGYSLSSLSAEDSEKWESRRLLQDFDIDSNYTDEVQVGPNAGKNCTPPEVLVLYQDSAVISNSDTNPFVAF
ncbi:hypothetical protein PO909_019416 [Leuciscus waleckii]